MQIPGGTIKCQVVAPGCGCGRSPMGKKGGGKKGGGKKGKKADKAPKEVERHVDSRYEGGRHEITNLYEGDGVYQYTNGGTYRGQWVHDMREGNGVYTFPDGSAAIGTYYRDREVGEGVFVSADRTRAWRSLDGIRKEPITLEVAEHIATQLGAHDVVQWWRHAG